MFNPKQKAVSDLLATPGMDEAVNEMLLKISQIVSPTSQEKNNSEIEKICIFSQKELDKMPKKFKKLFKVGSVTAHISRTDDGVYHIRCQINYHRYCGYSKNLEQAKLKFIQALHKEISIEKLTLEKQKVINRKGAAPTKLRAAEYFRHWLDTVKKGTIKTSTYDGYVQLSSKHIEPFFGDIYLTNINTLFLQKKFNDLFEQKHFRTAKKLKNLLGDMFKFAINNGDLTLNPVANINIPKYDEEHGEAISYEEEKELIDALLTTHTIYAQGLVFLLYTGLRIGELRSATIKDGWISCISEKVRFGLKDKIRDIPVSPMLAKVLPLIDIEAITKIKTQTLGRHIKDFLPNRTSKDLRHTFITRCRECKIQREVTSIWSGHIFDNSMTTKVYTHLKNNLQLQLEEISMFKYDL